MNGSMKTADRRLLTGALGAGAALALLAGAAAAQQGWMEVKPEIKSRMQIHERRGDTSYSLHVEDGRMWAEVDGERVPDERLRKSDGKVEILDEDGEVLTTFSYSEHGVGGMSFFAPSAPTPPAPRAKGGGFQIVQDDGEGQVWVADEAEQPKVMIGVTMVEVPEHLRRHLGLKENEAVMLDRVIEGLPADEAGLQSGDVIVAIAGEKPATASDLREALKEKEPGETLELTVVQEGKKKQITLKLRAYDPEKLAAGAPMALGRAEDVNRLLREQLRALEDQRRALGEEQRKLNEKGRRNQSNEFRLRNRELDEQMRRLREQMQELYKSMPGQGDEPMIFQIPPGEFHGLLTQPGARAGVEKRVKELDERLAELDERLSALDEKLGRIEKSLDRLAQEKDQR